MHAIILAGGTTPDLPTATKADLPIAGRPMVELVAQALTSVPLLQKVTVVRESGSLTDNLQLAVSRLQRPDDEYLLVSACDIPFLTPEAVEHFLRACQPGCDLYYPVVERRLCEERFPGVKRTCVRLQDGTFTGGNLFLLRVGAWPDLYAWINRLYPKRKSPLALAGELGFGLTLRFLWSSLFGTLSIAELERRAARLTGLRMKAVISPYPEIGTDIDKPEDLPLVSGFRVAQDLS
ncbi:MAG TPA: NTP transferase domain-containing protein [Bacilli bacterium]|nr:NTP transferase domain-containing protein [Bacilli bacterium]